MGSGHQAGDLESNLKRFARSFIDAVMGCGAHLQGVLKKFSVPAETQPVEKTAIKSACLPDFAEREPSSVSVYRNGMCEGILSAALPAIDACHHFKCARRIQPADDIMPFTITGHKPLIQCPTRRFIPTVPSTSRA